MNPLLPEDTTTKAQRRYGKRANPQKAVALIISLIAAVAAFMLI